MALTAYTRTPRPPRPQVGTLALREPRMCPGPGIPRGPPEVLLGAEERGGRVSAELEGEAVGLEGMTLFLFLHLVFHELTGSHGLLAFSYR